ncbi:MAG TPA: hypothetical protein VGI04_05530 [Neobacillus sp.]
MFKQISLLASLLFFLLATNVFAYSTQTTSSPFNGKHIIPSHTSVKKASKLATVETTAAQPTNKQAKEIEKQEPTLNSYVVPAVVGIILIIFIGSYWFIFRRKWISR